nr:NAD(P)-dependent oxidoreductase [Aquicoccus porphyridii]
MTGTTQQRGLLVLGASGNLGRMLMRHWQAGGPDGWSTTWQYRENPPANGIRWQPGEPAPAALSSIGAVLALWGVTPRTSGATPSDMAENTTLAIRAMELAAILGAERVLHCSSAAVYVPGPEPLGEDAAGGDINAYGRAKLDMEQAIADWCAAHPGGPGAVIMRIANMSGADALFTTIQNGARRVTLDWFASGEGPSRSYISVRGLAQAIETLLDCPIDPVPMILNVATQPPLSMEAIARAAGCGVDWRTAPEGAAPLVWLDTGRLERLTELPEESAASLVDEWCDGESAA